MTQNTSWKASHPFERSGLAALSDCRTQEWQQLFCLLESEQAEFLAREADFRSPEYRWPRDPLHTWSRVWEYPYTYHHLKSWREQTAGGRRLRAVDLGSGVTFFPFSVARLGYQVTCTDIDPICDRDLSRAAALLPCSGQNTVDFRLTNGNSLPFQDNEVDAVYCISVLEHIPDFTKTIDEMARILKPGGVIVLTFDLDLRGDGEIGVSRYPALIASLHRHFSLLQPERTVHPQDLLNTCSGPCPQSPAQGLHRYWLLLKQGLNPFTRERPGALLPFYLAVQGMVMVRNH